MDDATRSEDQIREHYEIEKELAGRLRTASCAERTHLYTQLYDELYRRVPHHPQLTRKASPAVHRIRHRMYLGYVEPHLGPDTVYLEVGPGDCGFALEVARIARKVYAIDVSNEITSGIDFPDNFEFVLSDGASIDVPPGSVDLAFSNQLMEHLHPDDALLQLRNIHRSLRPGGIYVCSTPNRISGPHDISRHFDAVATGLHLREYSFGELRQIFHEAGFVGVRPFMTVQSRRRFLPAAAVRAAESAIDGLPATVARPLNRTGVAKKVLGLCVEARRPA